ncbi:MAG: hypothetical protein J5659_04505 [Clostridia bacterium]|nr:hypothetical protein [Clostridia bacterium]
MSFKLLNDDIIKSCAWCLYGKKSEYTNDIFCKKRGITTKDYYCRKYKYDPLKRTPDKKIISDKYYGDDFSL